MAIAATRPALALRGHRLHTISHCLGAHQARAVTTLYQKAPIHATGDKERGMPDPPGAAPCKVPPPLAFPALHFPPSLGPNHHLPILPNLPLAWQSVELRNLPGTVQQGMIARDWRGERSPLEIGPLELRPVTHPLLPRSLTCGSHSCVTQSVNLTIPMLGLFVKANPGRTSPLPGHPGR